MTKIQKYKTQLEKLQNDKNTIENNRSDFLKKRGDDIARVRVRLEKEGILDPWKNGWVYRFTGIPVGADAKIERHDHFTNYVLFCSKLDAVKNLDFSNIGTLIIYREQMNLKKSVDLQKS